VSKMKYDSYIGMKLTEKQVGVLTRIAEEQGFWNGNPAYGRHNRSAALRWLINEYAKKEVVRPYTERNLAKRRE